MNELISGVSTVREAKRKDLSRVLEILEPEKKPPL
jgi:hypothetical protein